MASVFSQKTLVSSLPRPPSHPPPFLSQLPRRRLVGSRHRISAGPQRRHLFRNRRKFRPWRPDGKEEMPSSTSTPLPPLWLSGGGDSFPEPGRDEEAAMRPALGEPGGIEMPHSAYRSGSSSSWNPVSVKEAPREDFQEKYSSSSSLFKRNIYRMSAIRCFGVDLSPDNMAVAIVYFVQGVLGLARLAVSFYLKDDLHLDPAETALISGFASLPWLIKPLYGFISDSFPLFGYRRRSYLILSGLLGAFSWSLMATFVDSKYGAALCILLGSLSVAFSDVVVDSMVVERARGESQSTSGSLQSLCWGSSAFGGIVSSYFSGSLVGAYGVRFVFGVTAFLPLMTSAVAVLVKEQAMTNVRGSNMSQSGISLLESCKHSIFQLWNAVKQPDIFLPTLFIFLWQATPHSDSAMFYFTTNKLGFTPEFLGRVKLVTSVASLVGVGLYNTFLKNVPLRKIFLGTTIIGSALGMTQVILVTGLNKKFGISDEWFAIGDSLIITVLSQASFMPVLVLAAKLCPPGMEATLFATLMSISNGGSLAGGLMGAGLTQVLSITKDSFGNLSLLIILCNLSSLLPLPLLRLLPSGIPEDQNTGMEQTKLS